MKEKEKDCSAQKEKEKEGKKENDCNYADVLFSLTTTLDLVQK